MQIPHASRGFALTFIPLATVVAPLFFHRSTPAGVGTRHLVIVHGRWIRGTRTGAHPAAAEFAFPADVEPGETATVRIEMDTSALAEGEAVLEVTLAQDGMEFPAETTPALRLPVQVTRPPAKSPTPDAVGSPVHPSTELTKV